MNLLLTTIDGSEMVIIVTGDMLQIQMQLPDNTFNLLQFDKTELNKLKNFLSEKT